ncbi:RNA polymerase sigma factor [Gordonia rhizosphera]|uniref:Putative RNA polymerase ECF-type sigma factor n=1 Tax=Gordonia rhizosphera NBRC 16068 TaxID=1108045 RepID=K6W9D2_9ACTN|nr:RNA polymerase sigma factor [Gordonia rhizosphera]GAB88797.1 putative RNA polymerase ECF-type sigma factor [Gordonia rhizosphera NBRC 16068]
MTTDARAEIDRIYREEYGRVIASLVRRFGDLDIAEDAAGEALLTAVERWPAEGIPPNPGAWLTTTAGNRAIDRIRRESLRDTKHQAAMIINDDTPHEPTGAVSDDRLRLMFTCCHPALAPEARIALTLRLLGGLTVGEIARAFLVAETTMAQRITRAKAKIKAAHIPFRVPDRDDVTDRLDGVLTVIYLIFNEGYLAAAGDDPVRADLTAEAIRLGRIMRGLLPDDGEVAGLLALMLLTEARSTARISGGELVTLDQQDRGSWDHALIDEGHALVRECLARVAAEQSRPGRYQLMAAINAVHTDARDARDTDWTQVVALYDQLYVVEPTPIVALNRAVAVAELDGPEVALAIVDSLALDRYHAWHAARADLLRRLGRSADARSAYDAAIAATQNAAERAYLARRRDECIAQGTHKGKVDSALPRVRAEEAGVLERLKDA